MAHWKFSDHIYGQNIHLFVGPKDEHDAFVRRFDPNYKISTREPHGNCYCDDTLSPPLLTIWVPERFNVSSIADQATLGHECVHAMNYALGIRGLIMNDTSDEAYAYYHSWLYEECMNRLSRRSKRKCNQGQLGSPSTAQCSNDAPISQKAAT